MGEAIHTHRMRPVRDLIPFDEALGRLLAAARPVEETEALPVDECAGRVLAEPLTATMDVPGFDRAAMDGYALRHADASSATGRPTRLRVVDVLHAGDTPKRGVGSGECVRIATGAPMPPGADAVVMVEKTRMEENLVVVEGSVRPRENVTFRGSDVRHGDLLLSGNVLLTPARIATAATQGCAHLVVRRRPRVVVHATGAELRPPGMPLGAGDLHDSNSPALAALFTTAGAAVLRGAPLADQEAAVREALRGARGADLVVLSGGTSAGERDVVRDAVAAEGLVHFHGVRVKPGKPLLFGQVGPTLVLGLPGYPASCLSDAYLFAVPLLRRLAHLPDEPPRRLRAPLRERLESVRDRLWFVPVRLEAGLVVPTFKESGATTSLADAVGYVAVPPEVPFLEAGELVDVVLF